MITETCPCGSKKNYADCCELCIDGKQLAQTPEALMRSRYSAYTKANIAYIEKTMCGRASNGFNVDEARQWAQRSDWLGLNVIEVTHKSSKTACVEFIARFSINKEQHKIHELSEFHYINGRWYYVDGKMISS